LVCKCQDGKTRQNLESAKSQVYAQKPPLKLPFKNSSPGAGIQFLQKTSRKNQYSIYPGNQHKSTNIRIEICEGGRGLWGVGGGDCGLGEADIAHPLFLRVYCIPEIVCTVRCFYCHNKEDCVWAKNAFCSVTGVNWNWFRNTLISLN
jgi:hypothetical protein